jgi:hypothetical protein
MKEQSLIHVKIDYNEAVQSKKDLLSSEREFLRLLKTVKAYSLLRKDELSTKLRLQKKMKDLKLNLAKLHEALPKIKLPEILKKEREEFEEEEEERSSKMKKDLNNQDLESQLREIQDRLRRLG